MPTIPLKQRTIIIKTPNNPQKKTTRITNYKHTLRKLSHNPQPKHFPPRPDCADNLARPHFPDRAPLSRRVPGQKRTRCASSRSAASQRNSRAPREPQQVLGHSPNYAIPRPSRRAGKAHAGIVRRRQRSPASRESVPRGLEKCGTRAAHFLLCDALFSLGGPLRAVSVV